MKIAQQTQAWGNSTGVRLPKKVLQAVKWRHNQTVTIDVKGSAIILRPAEPVRKKVTIEELVSGITAKNIHGKTDWGSSAGQEIW